MQDQDLPALFRSADALAIDTQSRFLRLLGIHLVTLMTATALTATSIQHWSIATLQLMTLLGALACSVYLSWERPDKTWYAARAVAESIKTISWRYVCRAEPYQDSSRTADTDFRNTLRDIVNQNLEVCRLLTKHLDGNQLTQSMKEARSQSLQRRKEIYASSRVSDQLLWYARKANFNRTKFKVFSIALVVVNAGAVVIAALRIAFPEKGPWPTDIFVAGAACLLTWTQAKRFSELASSYALASHEISLIREQSLLPDTEEEFSAFVADAENAFSREHTQWAARRDI